MLPTRLQLEGPDLPQLVAQVRAEYGAAARIVKAERVRRGGVGGFFAREYFQILVELPLGAGPTAKRARGASAAPAPAGPAPVAPVPASVLDLVDRVNEHEEAIQRRLGARPAGPAVSTESASFADVLSRLQSTVEEPATAAPLLRPRDAGPQLAVPGPDPDRPFGVPANILAGADGAAGRYRRLVAWLETFPMVPPPVYAPGQVIAVVGELGPAMRVGTLIAGKVGVDRAGMFVASPGAGAAAELLATRVLADPTEVAQRRQAWGHGTDSRVVVVEAPLLLDPPRWAGGVLAALAPTFTWGVVQASTKVNDITAWAARLGQLDALAVQNVAATGDPAGLLGGPVPVGMLDTQRASVPVWADLLAARLVGVR